MAESIRDRFIQNSPWRVILLAVVLLVIGESLLAWQYRRLEGERIEGLEQKIEQQQQTIEVGAAKEALRAFLEARIANDENRAARYITEEAAFQRQQGLFEFSGVEDYSINQKEKLGEGIFRFQVEITRDRLLQIEFIEVKKFSDEYYVNSVELAG